MRHGTGGAVSYDHFHEAHSLSMRVQGMRGHFSKYWILALVFPLLSLSPSLRGGGIEYPVTCNIAFSFEHLPVMMRLLEASESTTKARALDLQTIHESVDRLDDSSEMRPLHTFLIAEVLQLRGDEVSARRFYRSLAEWAASDPYEDNWGGSGLAAVSIWRWLQQVSTETCPDRDESLHFIEVADQLLNTRLVKGMFHPYHTHLLCSMPLLEEDIRRNLAKLAWNVDARDKAGRLFLDYLEVTSIADLDSVENQIVDHLVLSRMVTRDHLGLFRGKRLISLGKYKKAYNILKRIHTESANLQVRAKAGLYMARVEPILDEQKKVSKRDEVAELLGSVIENAGDPNVAQEALFDRAILLNREGQGKNREQARIDLERLVDEFPYGRFADDALFELARYYQNAGNLENALAYYERVQRFKGENDRFDTSHFYAAFSLYQRGRPEDIERAIAMLRGYVERHPYGPLYLNALFWIGRMISEKGDRNQADTYFRLIIETSPWDYYAIRARMHLNLGDAAREKYAPDPVTRDEIRSVYERSRIDSSLDALSSYHGRVDYSIRSGLYKRALISEQELVNRFTFTRLENIDPEELDDAGLMTRISILLSLRQDVLAAADFENTSSNLLSIGGAIGYVPGDWALAISIVTAANKSCFDRAALQRDERYLATNYPIIFYNEFRTAAEKYQLQPEWLYSVSRRESFFYASALSKKGAMGLFQFSQRTFEGLNKDWNVLGEGEAKETYLLDPELNIDLWARWFKLRLLKRYQGNYFLSFLHHISGGAAVQEWVGRWQSAGRGNDIEYMVETCKYVHTRIIARGVLTDLAIVQAADLFGHE